jgi:O-antigen/teichoic acid export membrane protein
MLKTVRLSGSLSAWNFFPAYSRRTGLFARLRGNVFLRHNTVVFTGSLAIGFLNYLYYPVLGRLMAPSGFGEIQVLASLLAQIVIFLNVFGLLTVNIVANYNDARQRNRLIVELEKLALVISLVFLAASLVFGTLLQRFFHFGSSTPFALLTLAVAASVPLTFRSAYLRGRKRFAAVVWVGIAGSAADLVLAALFVWLGFGAAGAMFGLVLGQLAAFAVAAVAARRSGFSERLSRSFLRLPDIRLMLPELRYAGLVLACSLGIIVMYSMDTVVVKHYFDAHTAGLYAGIATIARIIFFVTASVVTVLLPSVKLQHKPKENQRVLLKSFVLLAGLGGITLLGFALLPRLIIRVLMGSAYLHYSYLLPRLGLVLFLISVTNLFVMYHLALRRALVVPVVIIGLAVVFGVLRVHHSSPQAIIDSLFFGSLAMLALLGGWTGANMFKRPKAAGALR